MLDRTRAGAPSEQIDVRNSYEHNVESEFSEEVKDVQL